MFGQRGDVFAALPQGRRCQWYHIQAKVEVFSKFALFDFGVQVFVCRSDDAHIYPKGFGAAYPFKFALLERRVKPWPVPTDSCRRFHREIMSLYRPGGILPSRVLTAPVNAPRSLPNNSLSMSSSGMAAQFTLTKEFFAL